MSPCCWPVNKVYNSLSLSAFLYATMRSFESGTEFTKIFIRECSLLCYSYVQRQDWLKFSLKNNTSLRGLCEYAGPDTSHKLFLAIRTICQWRTAFANSNSK